MTLVRTLSRSLAIVLFCVAVLLFASLASAQQSQLQAYTAVAPATDAAGNAISPAQAAANSDLATFTYKVVSSRDGNTFSGSMVGQDPFGANFTTTSISTPIIPVILITNTIAVASPNGKILTTKPGVTVFDPTAPDDACLGRSNNVPLTLMEQSPIFQSNAFVFGDTAVGDTQYLDAFQRGNFWKFVGGTDYHTILTPHVLPAVTINLPGKQGLAGRFGGTCGPLAIVDFDVMLRQVFNKLLVSEGANLDSSKFPIFLFYNTVMATNSSGGSNCCILGFHNAVTQNAAVAPNKAARVQTYAFIDFEASGAFGPDVHDTTIAAHEVGEWMDDPFGNNPTPAWGHTGQVGACQGNLEVGDPLTGTNIPLVTGTNGFKYHLQELAFFSWFYGAPSIAVNGWFSNNNTFKTDAGPVCTKH
jgi:hypothetical protein